MNLRVKPFAPIFKRMIKEKGITQVELCRRTGLSQSCMTKLLTGERFEPTRTTMILIARALGVSVDELC
jgi:transcriptional regulator with XRE-family HTH domain